MEWSRVESRVRSTATDRALLDAMADGEGLCISVLPFSVRRMRGVPAGTVCVVPS